MKHYFFIVIILLVFSTSLHAESSYFLACQEGTITNVFDFNAGKNRNFKKGDLFEVPDQALRTQNRRIINNDPQGSCWSDTGNTTCPLVVDYGRTLYGGGLTGSAGSAYLHGSVDLGLGCWFKSEGSFPINDNTAGKVLGFLSGFVNSTRDEYFERTLDKAFVDVMCSQHPSKFTVAGYTFTDLKKEKTEAIAKKTEDARQQQIAREEQLRKDSEEKTRQAEAKEAVKKECKKILEVYYQEYNNKVRSKAPGYPAKEFLPDVIIKIDQDSRDILVIQHNLISATIAFDILDIKKLKEVVYKSNFKTLVFQNKETYWWWEACEQDSNPEVLLNRKGKKPQSRIEYERTESEIKARIDYANQLEKSYLARGRDMQVTAENTPDGSDIKKALLFHYTFMDKSIAYNIVKDPGFRKAVRSLGFDQVHFVAVRSNHPELNSYVYYVHEQKLYKVWGKDEGLYIE